MHLFHTDIQKQKVCLHQQIPFISHNYYFLFHRLIRLSSPNLNYLIGLGAIVLYLNIITLVIPTTNTHFAAVLCNVIQFI